MPSHPVSSSVVSGKRSGNRTVVMLVSLLGVVSLASLGMFMWVARGDRHALVPPTAILNSLPGRRPITRATAASALLNFTPSNDTTSVGQAIAHATGYRWRPGQRFPGQVVVNGYQAGRWLIRVRVRVNLGYLSQHGEITTGHFPGASHPRQGHILVTRLNTVYAVSLNPRNHLAVYRFALDHNDAALWSLNWNSNGIVSQSASLD